MRTILAGAAVAGCGLALHLVEPVSRLACARATPGPAECTIARSFYGFVPYERTTVQAAALVAEPRRLGRVDPEAVSCTSLALMDGAGETTEFACVKNADAVARAQRFFADGSGERELGIRHGENLVTWISGVLVAGGILLGAFGARRRRTGKIADRRPTP